MNDLALGYRTICSSGTVYSHKKGFFYEFCESAKEAIGLTYIFNIFKKLKEDQDRITKMYKDDNVKIIIINILNKISVIYKKKDAINSKKKRIDCLHNKKNEAFMNILHQLNQAVVEAPEINNCTTIDDGYTLPLVLVTRADLLLKQKDYMHAYKDFKILSELNLPFLNTKTIFQKIRLCRSRQSLLQVNDFKTKSYRKWKDETQNKNSNFSSMSKLVKIRKSSSAGNEAIANSVINPGEALIIETPTASCLLPEFYNSHCQTCLKRCKIMYGCPDCIAVGFCSYKCRNIGLNSFHKYECKISSILVGSGMSILSHLALRIITQLGLQKCVIIYHYLHEDQMCLGLEDYLKLYDLEKHTSERSPSDFFERSLMAVFLVRCLKQVNFFHSMNTLHLNELKSEIIVGTLLLKHLQLLQFNTHEIYENNNENDPISYCMSNPLYIGVGIYSTAAKFNHQCYSATVRYFSGNIIILRASRLLQINDVIAENYGPVFTKKAIIERQRYLAGRYWFNCYCKACINNWPLLNEMKCNHVQIRCSSKYCSEYISVRFDENLEKLYFCKTCHASKKFSKLHQNIIKKCILWFAYGITLMNRQYINEAIQLLLVALRIFHHIANAPYRFMHLAEMGLQYCLMNNK